MKVSQKRNIIVGIDAANIRGGGGVTHLVEILRALQPDKLGIDRVIVWGGNCTLIAIEDRNWIDKRNLVALNKNLVRRALWQIFELSKAAEDERCDVLFVPGGSFVGRFKPVVTMSQNLLPFENRELMRFGCSVVTFKLMILRFIQSSSFSRSNGVIFLTKYARGTILGMASATDAKTPIIPHGINKRFIQAVKTQRPITDYDQTNPYRVLYVSIVDQYKHQWHVVEALAVLRREGFPVVLELVGPAYPPALERLEKTIDRVDSNRNWVHYHGPITFDSLHLRYAEADLGLFASSCENMPNILLETMAAGLPIACSNRGPMPEVLGSAGLYFDPERPAEIASAVRTLISCPKLRWRLAQISSKLAKGYSWNCCAETTFRFLAGFSKN
jgi:glycosyltransferase involved in cell wall biosynthesis